MAGGGFGVQTAVVAAGAFVVGLVLGGVGPRGEVRELEAKVFELEKTRTRGGGTQAGADLARLITTGIEGGAAAGEGAASTGDPARPRRPGDTDAAPVDGAPGVNGQDPLAVAREALELRRTQARAALVEDVDPTGEQLDEIDRVFGEMNAELEQIARGFVSQIPEGTEPTRREMMAVGADTLDVLSNAEEQLLSVLSPEQRAAVREEATDPTSYVDPRVIDVLAPLAPAPAAEPR